MKEIKFRGKRVDNGMWVCGYYFEAPLTHETGECASYLCGDRRFLISKNGVTFDVLPETVGQFTGLFTKSLKEETFDGDLIGTPNGIVLEICWSGISGQWRTRFYNTSVKGKDAGGLAERLNDGYMRVIGNIHEKVEKEKP